MGSGGIARDARIVIVGAGAAGICTAWYLKQAGFNRVKVLEKSPRLGGKCRSITVDGQSFDLGANYVTSAYARVRQLAAHVGATMYTEKPGHAINAKTGHVRSILAEVLKHTTLPTLAMQAVRYLWKRWRIRHLLTPYRPGFGHVQQHTELRGSFADWLDRNGLAALDAELVDARQHVHLGGQALEHAAVSLREALRPATQREIGREHA